jgi:hypothetical protein
MAGLLEPATYESRKCRFGNPVDRLLSHALSNAESAIIQSRSRNGTEIPIIAMGTWEGSMKLPHRRHFLHLAAGVAALPAIAGIVKAGTRTSAPTRIAIAYAGAVMPPSQFLVQSPRNRVIRETWPDVRLVRDPTGAAIGKEAEFGYLGVQSFWRLPNTEQT